LRGQPVSTELGRVADGVRTILGAESARIELGPQRHPPAGESPLELRAGSERVGTLYIREGAETSLAARRRFLPALGSVLAVALERERLARDAQETEALRRSDTVKTAVLRAVSHDLRSPLTAIRVAAGTLQRSYAQLADTDRSSLIDAISLESARLERIVANLLDLSKLEAGAALPQRGICAIDALIGRALGELGSSSGRIDVSLPDDVALVEVDATQLERVLVNLLENALKFSPTGERVLIRVTQTRNEVLVRIVDHGPGIPEAELERVFDAFRYASTGGERQGSGLGLAIARGFAEVNDGRVWAESHPGQGATFVLALPLASVPAPVA
jgi:two-component system sensor histidine kinase KdpD